MFSIKFYIPSKAILSHLQYQSCLLPKRTVFDFIKFWKDPRPKVNPADLPYSVVTPAAVSPRRYVPETILKPDYAESGIPGMPPIFPILADDLDVERMRAAGQMARKVLDLAAKEVQVGTTTDKIDEVVHQACLDNKVYPSPLNYKGFPKSVCTSVNNVLVHGIPDSRPLQDGDIINIDVTVFLQGYHGDVSETYLVGDVDDRGKKLVEIARKCRDEAIMTCCHGRKIREIGNVISRHAEQAGFAVCTMFVGHGIGKLFHCKPDIWHYANHYPEEMHEGMIFTIEPVILEYQDVPVEDEDGWTMTSENYARSAQFEHTVLVTNTGVEVLTAGANENFLDVDSDGEGRKPTLSKHEHEWEFKP